MADVSISEDALHIALSVPERVLSLHDGAVDIPLRQIVKVVAVPDVVHSLRGRKASGAAFGGPPTIGAWRGDQAGRSFTDFAVIRRHGPGIVVTLRGGPFDRVLFDTPRSEDLVAALTPRPPS